MSSRPTIQLRFGKLPGVHNSENSTTPEKLTNSNGQNESAKNVSPAL